MDNAIGLLTSEKIDLIVPALEKAYQGFDPVVRDSENPVFKSTFASLAATLKAVVPSLLDNGLLLTQAPWTANGKVNIDTALFHTSGQWMRMSLGLTPVKNDPQGVGSAITYARRYSVQSLLGLAPEDDDGNKASEGGGEGEKPKARSRAPKPEPEAAPDSEERQKANRRLFALIDEYATVGGDAGRDLKEKMHETESRHALVARMFPGKHRLAQLTASDLDNFARKISQRIDEAVGAYKP